MYIYMYKCTHVHAIYDVHVLLLLCIRLNATEVHITCTLLRVVHVHVFGGTCIMYACIWVQCMVMTGGITSCGIPFLPI